MVNAINKPTIIKHMFDNMKHMFYYSAMTWLILIHQIPAKPTYLRAKIWRRLQQVGAIPIKQAVYVMPDTEQNFEDLGWIAKEITDRSGEAVILNAKLLEGLTDKQVVELFKKARRTDYEKILAEARTLLNSYHSKGTTDSLLSECKAGLRRLTKSFNKTVGIDFFPGAEQSKTEAYLTEMETIFHKPGANDGAQVVEKNTLSGHTWVTKSNVYVDRMASAWFIKRFVDTQASFKFITGTQYQPREGELRYDMQEAEYTHQDNYCTFEVLVKTFCPDDRGLGQIAKLIHDIDLKDELFDLPETPGFRIVLDAIVAASSNDLKRIEQAGAILDGLMINYTNKR